MARYDRGYDRSLRPASGDWSAPYGSRRGLRYDREHSGSRPWVGGELGFQGGSYGIPVGRRGYDAGFGGYSGYDAGLRDAGPRGSRRRARSESYGGDYWWLGERAFRDSRTSYDDRYRRFDESHQPRYSPVGGNYQAMGGQYQYRPLPRPLREEQWFSDWTRWF